MDGLGLGENMAVVTLYRRGLAVACGVEDPRLAEEWRDF
jgi:hypothetical protein